MSVLLRYGSFADHEQFDLPLHGLVYPCDLYVRVRDVLDLRAEAAFRLLHNGRVLPDDKSEAVDLLKNQSVFCVVSAPRASPAPAAPAASAVVPNKARATTAEPRRSASGSLSSSLSSSSAVNVEEQVYKVTFLDDEMRRFRMPLRCTLAALHAKLAELFGEQWHAELRVAYTDSDGDEITVTSEIEWLEARREFGERGTVRLRVRAGVAGEGRYFKDGPPPQLLGFHTAASVDAAGAELEPPATAERKQTAKAVPEFLASLFPRGKILPHNIPSWLRPAVRPIVRGVDTVDLDIDVEQLARVMNERALRLFEQRDLVGARDLLVKLNDWRATPVSAYNLGCAYSLLNDVDTALIWLQIAIESGYRNLAHIMADEDLVNARKHRDFNELVQLIIEKNESSSSSSS